MAQHSSGPWKVDPCTWGGLRNVSGNHVAVCQVVGGEERDANARLIAAAPEMLEGLKQAEEWLSGWASAEPYLTTIRAAIAKAEGK